MLKSNLIWISRNMCVDWAAVVEVIDDLGGLDLNITQGEMNQINKYKKDVDGVTGKEYPECDAVWSGIWTEHRQPHMPESENFSEISQTYPVRELCCR